MLAESPVPRLRCCDYNLPDPARQTVVLLHGWGNDSRCWQPLCQQLEQNFNLQLIDLPGFGINADVDWPDSTDALIDELIGLLPRQAHLIGWSLGGMLAVQMAARVPERIATLTTIAANARFCRQDGWSYGCTEALYDSFYEGFTRSPERTRNRFLVLLSQGDAASKRVLQHLRDGQSEIRSNAWRRSLKCLNTLDNRTALEQLCVPHIAIFGDRDPLLPLAAAQAFRAHGFCREIWVAENCGHAPHIAQAQWLAAKWQRFVSRGSTDAQRSKYRVARSFGRAARHYDQAAGLQKQTAERLLQLRGNLRGTIVDLGCGTGFIAGLLPTLDSRTLIGVDIAHPMLQQCRFKSADAYQHLLCGDMESLPLRNKSVDGLISNFSMQWCEDIHRLMAECRRVLKPGGWLLFSTLTEGTLRELELAWRRVDRHVHVNRFVSQHLLCHAIDEAGFSLRVLQHQQRMVWFDGVLALMRSLKAIGAHNVNAGENRGLTTARQLQQLNHAFETFRQGDKIPASYQISFVLAEAKR